MRLHHTVVEIEFGLNLSQPTKAGFAGSHESSHRLTVTPGLIIGCLTTTTVTVISECRSAVTMRLHGTVVEIEFGLNLSQPTNAGFAGGCELCQHHAACVVRYGSADVTGQQTDCHSPSSVLRYCDTNQT